MREIISKTRDNCAKCVEPIEKGDRVAMVTMQNWSFARVHAKCYQRMKAIAMAVERKRVSLSPLVMDNWLDTLVRLRAMTVVFQDYYPDPENNLREWRGEKTMPCHWCRARIGKGEMYVTVFDNGRFFVAHDESPENCEF